MATNHACSTRQRQSKPGLLRALALLTGLSMLDGCQAKEPSPPVGSTDHVAATPAEPEEMRMWMTIGGRRFSITLADTAAARAFRAQLPLTLEMADLNGNEKHADLPTALPANASRPGTISRGDVMLYGSRTVVVFYETFGSSYAYTRIGRLDDPAELVPALGGGTVRVTFMEE